MGTCPSPQPAWVAGPFLPVSSALLVPTLLLSPPWLPHSPSGPGWSRSGSCGPSEALPGSRFPPAPPDYRPQFCVVRPTCTAQGGVRGGRWDGPEASEVRGKGPSALGPPCSLCTQAWGSTAGFGVLRPQSCAWPPPLPGALSSSHGAGVPQQSPPPTSLTCGIHRGVSHCTPVPQKVVGPTLTLEVLPACGFTAQASRGATRGSPRWSGTVSWTRVAS